MTDRTVGPGGDYATVALAYAAALDGESILFECDQIHSWAAKVTVSSKVIHFGNFGAGTKPLIRGFYTTTIAGNWTEVSLTDGLTPASGTHLWMLDGGTTASNRPLWVRFGSFEPIGAGIMKDVYGETESPAGNAWIQANAPAANKEFGSWVAGVGGDTHNRLWVYSVGNPVTYYGAVYYQSDQNSLLVYNTAAGWRLEDLSFENALRIVRYHNTTGGMLAGPVFKNLDVSNVYRFQETTGNSTNGYIGGGIFGCTISDVDDMGIYTDSRLDGYKISGNSLTRCCRVVSTGGIYIDNNNSQTATPLLISGNRVSFVDHGNFWVSDGGGIEYDSDSYNIRAWANVVTDCYEAFHNNSGRAGIVITGNVIDRCDRAYTETDALNRNGSTTLFRNNTCLVYADTVNGTGSGSTAAAEAMNIRLDAVATALTFSDNVFVKLSSPDDGKCFYVDNTLYGAAGFAESRNVVYGFGVQSSTTTGSPITLDSSDSTADPRLSSQYLVQNPSHKNVGAWSARIHVYDDLPLPLHPDLGAVQDRDAAGRKFGIGGGSL